MGRSGVTVVGRAWTLLLAALAPLAAHAAAAEAPFARAKLARHLPSSTVTMVLVDVDKVRAADASGGKRWTDVVLAEISQRFRFEQHKVDLGRDVGAFAFFEEWDGARYGRGFLIERRDGAPAPPRDGSIRDFQDGTYAIAEPRVLGRLQAAGSPEHLRSLLARLDLAAPILGVCRHRLVLEIPRCTLDPLELPLPAAAFALQVGFGEQVQVSGQLITQGPARAEDGRTFLAAFVDFLRPQGSFGPDGAALAAEAELTPSDDAMALRMRIPRDTLVVEAETGATMRMTSARGGQVMALLPDGRVLAAGGFDGQRGLATIDVIDPEDGTAQLLPVELTKRRVASAGALVAGGDLYIFYGMEGVGEGMEPVSAEMVDLRLGSATRLPVPDGPGRIGATATVLGDGTILVAGGPVFEDGAGAPDAYVFDTTGRTFTPVAAPMAVPRGDHAAVPLRDGRVLLAGGITRGHAGPLTDSLEVYDPETRRFALLPGRLPSPRTGLAGTLLPDGRAVFLGGYDDQASLAEIVAFDAGDGSVRVAGQMREARYYFAAVTLPDGRVLAAGGGMGRLAMRDSIEIWDPRALSALR